ncbi:hypothetical protein PHACT_12570 [Pseudohongiella acticola]|uniref:Phage gp6-like head-tail connector protein n=1 Tax=Pseudohongiella acticola TaxID=1524254 RepID=A0A1E8CGC7_9GAMM|nr:head-tail connector protein [Pseudohongiella acticola]OFE11385.1 hypothetical protein PHACT_12570 [Pseudohongiella acticola]
MVDLEFAKLQVHLEAEDTAENALLDVLIRAAYRFAEAHTQTRIAPTQVVLVLDRFPVNSNPIEVPWTPVRAISSLEYIDQDGQEQSLDPETLRLDSRSIYASIYPQFGTSWPVAIAEPESVTITLDVGFAEDDEPADITAAILLTIGHLYENRESVVIGSSAVELPFGVKALLADYVITAVG